MIEVHRTSDSTVAVFYHGQVPTILNATADAVASLADQPSTPAAQVVHVPADRLLADPLLGWQAEQVAQRIQTARVEADAAGVEILTRMSDLDTVPRIAPDLDIHCIELSTDEVWTLATWTNRLYAQLRSGELANNELDLTPGLGQDGTIFIEQALAGAGLADTDDAFETDDETLTTPMERATVFCLVVAHTLLAS